MKRIALLVALIGALLLSQTAAADNRGHRRGYDHDRAFGNSYRHSNHYGYRSYGYRSYGYRTYGNRSYGKRSYGYNPYHYGSRRGNSINISYGNHYYRRHDHNAGYFVGGLVLGSLLSAPRYAPPPVERVIYRSAPVVTTREVVVVNQSAPIRTPVASGRRLLRDLEGNCFERIIDAEGNEIRVQLEAQECSF